MDGWKVTQSEFFAFIIPAHIGEATEDRHASLRHLDLERENGLAPVHYELGARAIDRRKVEPQSFHVRPRLMAMDREASSVSASAK